MYDRLKYVQNSCDVILAQTELHAGSAQTFASHEIFKLKTSQFLFFTCLLETPPACADFLVDSLSSPNASKANIRQV